MKLLITILAIMLSISAKAQYLGVGETMNKVLNDRQLTLKTVEMKKDKKGDYIETLVSGIDTTESSFVTCVFAFKGTCLTSTCYYASLGFPTSIEQVNKMVQRLNKYCTVVNDRNWLNYSGNKIYSVQLALNNGVYDTFVITEKKKS